MAQPTHKELEERRKLRAALDGMTWEQRFNVAWSALLKMEMRAESAESQLAEERMPLFVRKVVPALF